MNILASYKWLKEFVKTDLPAPGFAREMSLKSMSVESVEWLFARYAHVCIGKVVEVKTHPNADKLKIAIVDVGDFEGNTPEYLANSPVEIVCGGKNLAVGQSVVVALPGAKVRWHGEGDFVELKQAKIRGVDSYGMICAANELGFEKYPAKEGDIWDVTELTQAQPGTRFAEAFDIDDTLFDIEVTTNRPDAMSIVGLAREAGAVLEASFEPPIELPISNVGARRASPLHVTVAEPDLCPRYMAVVIDGVKVKPSPLWLQMRLLLAGYRPINNIVDITNYVLHEMGQPLHAFDYAKLSGGKIEVRKAKKGEKFQALDDNEYELSSDQLVIADSEKAVAIAGVMGGKDSGTWDGTTSIVFEAAVFDAASIRRTARELNLHSQSQSMFEKGLSSESPAPALARAVELALELAGGEVASAVIDERAAEYQPLVFPFRPEKARALIGVDIEASKMISTLERLGFEVKKVGEAYEVTVPYWRDHDIEAEVDFTEEIARLYGYHNLPAELPNLAPPTTPEDPILHWEDWVKQTLMASGYTELYGYSFVSATDLEKYDLDPSEAIRLYNELTTDQTHMRTSLMPSLLKDIEANQGETPSGAVFELQKVYIPRKGDLPDERTHLMVARYGDEDIEEALLKLKGVVEFLTQKAGLNAELVRDESDARWHFTRSASVKIDDVVVGKLGQVAEDYQQAFKIDKPVVAASLDLQNVLPKMKRVNAYQEVPEFPKVERDIAAIVDEFTEFGQMQDAIKKQSPLIEAIGLKDVYRGAGIPEGKKSVTLAITLRAPDRTLSSEHADDAMRVIQDVLKKSFDAIIR